VAALQHLPARQRACLLLTEVLGWSAAETAESLEMTVAAVNSALQRARATLGNRAKLDSRAALTEEEAEAVERYADAFHRYDVDALAALLRDDATMSMPPYTLWLQGPESIKGWLTGPGCGCRGSKLVRVEASGWPAFAQYRASAEGGYHAWGLIVLEVEGSRIKSWNSFLDVETLFPRFGLPLKMAS
ncbi:MAG TPA: sigma factor-like helix-turn-helix DNA-binding protein, partial [Thermoanaerobaculia bacterium]